MRHLCSELLRLPDLHVLRRGDDVFGSRHLHVDGNLLLPGRIASADLRALRRRHVSEWSAVPELFRGLSVGLEC